MKKVIHIRSLVTTLFLLLLGIIMLSTNVIQTYGQTNTPTTPAQTSMPPTATQFVQQQDDTLEKTYQQVLETSKRTVEEVHQTANIVLNWVGVIFVALTLGGFGGAWLLSTFARRASDKATNAQQKAAEALDVIKNTARKTSELEKRNGIALKTASELADKQISLFVQIESAEKVLDNLRKEIAQIKSSGEKDRQVLKKPLTLVQIDDYGMQLLSDTTSEKESAVSALIEMSTRSDAVVRRRSIKTLGILDFYDERVAKRLREVIAMDKAEGVRKEAEKSLKLIEAKKPKKKTTRRKP